MTPQIHLRPPDWKSLIQWCVQTASEVNFHCACCLCSAQHLTELKTHQKLQFLLLFLCSLSTFSSCFCMVMNQTHKSKDENHVFNNAGHPLLTHMQTMLKLIQVCINMHQWYLILKLWQYPKSLIPKEQLWIKIES